MPARFSSTSPLIPRVTAVWTTPSWMAPLTGIEKLEPIQARIGEPRFFVGLTVEEIAGFMGVSERTVLTVSQASGPSPRRRPLSQKGTDAARFHILS